ncbi:UDP-N-acetylglucosamine--peptide N-acetylglucosaminyltransferase GtfA subunit [Sporomusa carbonis]|uniref:glycosyltransferase n=1 Tax=Sporomusa carbonis TaxID=3076075 RepID=UPI003A684E33
MNVLMISVRADYGGGPEHVFRLMQQIGNDVCLFVACPREYPYWERYCALVGVNNMIEIPHRKFSIASLWGLIRFVVSKEIDLVHSHGKGAGLYSRLISILMSKPCVHTFHGIHVGKYNSITRLIYLAYERLFSYMTNRLIAVSEGEAEIIRDYGICSNKKLKVIPNGVNIPDGVKLPDKKEKRVFHIISVSRFDYQKNSQLAILIMKKLFEYYPMLSVQLDFIGTGEGEKELHRKISEEMPKLPIYFQGAVINPEEYYSRADCYLSTSRWEGMPLAVLEAMAWGLPVIATNVVGNKDIVRHGYNGFLFEVDQPEVAVQQIFTLMSDRALYRQFSEQARNLTTEQFSAAKMAERTYNVYCDVLRYNKVRSS